MDIHDITKHPFKIECPAELKDEPDQAVFGEVFGDHWVFTFDNGFEVSCLQRPDYGTDLWEVAVREPNKDSVIVVGILDDDTGVISNLIDHVAHLSGSDSFDPDKEIPDISP